MKIKRIIVITCLFLILLTSQSYAKYVINFETTVAKLTRDSVGPKCTVSYSTSEWTNQNVIVTITSDKEIEGVSNFKLSKDKKTLTKEVSKNEEKTLRISDLSGNYTNVAYKVSNIDKTLPKIIGCENGKTYYSSLKLNYEDNIGIKDVIVDKYEAKLNVECYDAYYDSYLYFGTDRADDSIRINITTHPLNTRKYILYLNNTFYGTTFEDEFIFTGLEKGKTYDIKVEAVNENGNVLDTIILTKTTGFYHYISSNKTSSQFESVVHGIDSRAKILRYAVWNDNKREEFYWYEPKIINGETIIKIDNYDKINYPAYTIHVYVYDKNENQLDFFGYHVDFNTNYNPETSNIDKYNLTQKGKYQITVTDLADNKITYYIEIK